MKKRKIKKLQKKILSIRGNNKLLHETILGEFPKLRSILSKMNVSSVEDKNAFVIGMAMGILVMSEKVISKKE